MSRSWPPSATGRNCTPCGDSKDPDGPALMFTPAEWDAFITGVKAGEFDTAAHHI